jgi:ferredoxin-NADP reductase
MFTAYIVDQVITESTTIKSFYLKPRNGGDILTFLPGQYVDVTVTIPGAGRDRVPSYSLSDWLRHTTTYRGE